MPSGKGSKLLRYIEHRLRVTLSDSRIITGTFLAFDKHLNLVLADSEEHRTLRSSAGGNNRANVVEERLEKRHLGLIILRGENVVSLAVEGPPPSSGGRLGMAPGGPGISVGAGRGTVNLNMGGVPPVGGGAAPVGLGAAPVHGVGGPGGGVMGMPPGGLGMPQGMGRGRGVPGRY